MNSFPQKNMGWTIKCHSKDCQEATWAENIVDLIQNYRNGEGWFTCNCGHSGYIEKSFQFQEEGEVWEPYLRGIIPLGDTDDTYQPFIFIVSYTPDGDCKDVWFSYYKDLRSDGGKLKLGYGPGGPPVLSKDMVKLLLRSLKEVGYFKKEDFEEFLK